VLRHPGDGERIADVVLQCRPRLSASDPEQCSVISAAQYRKSRKTLKVAPGAFGFTASQQFENPGIELRNRAFERRLNFRKGLCGFDFDMLDVDCSLSDHWVKHSGDSDLWLVGGERRYAAVPAVY